MAVLKTFQGKKIRFGAAGYGSLSTWLFFATDPPFDPKRNEILKLQSKSGGIRRAINN